MKLITISLASWLVGLATILLVFFVAEGLSFPAAEVRSATLVTVIVAALLFSLSYAPLLLWLRQQLGGCRPAALFPIISALLLNLPAFVIGILAIGRTLILVQAFAFMVSFVLMGTAFGVCFVWNYRDRDLKSEAWSCQLQFRKS